MTVKRGDRVSLNIKKRIFFFQGSDGINLRANIDETALIPEDISDRNLETINRALGAGHLSVGWAKERKPDAPLKKDDTKLLENGIKKLIPLLEQIAVTRGRDDDSPVARLERLLESEKEGKNSQGTARVTVVKKIEELLSNMSGISSVSEEINKEEIKINLA